MNSYIVVCRDDRTADNKPGPYILATRQVFASKSEAEQWAEDISPSREAIVVTGRFEGLRHPAYPREMTREDFEQARQAAPEERPYAPDWAVAKVTDRGPGNQYRYQVEGWNDAQEANGERNCKFIWSVPDLDWRFYWAPEYVAAKKAAWEKAWEAEIADYRAKMAANESAR